MMQTHFSQTPLLCKLPEHRLKFSDSWIEKHFPENVFREIILCRSFQRLKDIRFLGAIDYMFVPNQAPSNRRHTRFDHVVGVANLTRKYVDHKGFSNEHRMYAILAALLHDIGHGPLSHSAEPVFREFFGIDHKILSREIVLGRTSSFPDVSEILQRNGFNPTSVVNVMENKTNFPTSSILSGKVNLDTIEGVCRSYRYCNNVRARASADRVLDAFIQYEETGKYNITLDEFWRTKGDVYTFLIQGVAGRWADYIVRREVVNNLSKFKKSDFEHSETTFLNQHKFILRSLISARQLLYDNRAQVLSLTSADEEIKYRKFSIVKNQNPNYGELQNRLHETVVEKPLTVPKTAYTFGAGLARLKQSNRGGCGDEQLKFQFKEHRKTPRVHRSDLRRSESQN